MVRRFLVAGGLVLLALALEARPARAYGVLSHLAVVDAAWEATLVPALRQRFPGLTADDLHRAHACAYGGALAQDMGYYPGGSRELADLMHYVRSGDFVRALVDESRDPGEYAFALGALAHYLADSEGHPLGVNRVVPLTFPKLRRRFGDSVNYGQDPKAHLRVEFGFDVVQVARGLYPSEAYRDFIGFEVPLPLLDRAVRRTYGLALTDFLARPEHSVRSFRKFEASLFPKATRVAWAYKKDEIRKLLPGMESARFVYNLSNAAFEKEWGKDYDRPGLLSRVGAFLLRFVPKVGPLRILIPKPPTPEGERIYEESFNRVLADYRAAVQREVTHDPTPANVNLDVGAATAPGAYPRADKAQAELARRLASR
jgi:zinc dependent phospholipase C